MTLCFALVARAAPTKETSMIMPTSNIISCVAIIYISTLEMQARTTASTVQWTLIAA